MTPSRATRDYWQVERTLLVKIRDNNAPMNSRLKSHALAFARLSLDEQPCSRRSSIISSVNYGQPSIQFIRSAAQCINIFVEVCDLGGTVSSEGIGGSSLQFAREASMKYHVCDVGRLKSTV